MNDSDTQPLAQQVETVLVFGSFDMLHKGHRYFLQHSRHYGQRLLAVLARDEEIYYFKQRKPAWDFERRKNALLSSGLIDEVISSDQHHGTFYVLHDLAEQGREADLIVLGDGQEALGASLEEFFRRSPQYRCPIAYVQPKRRRLLSSTRLHQLHLLLAHLALLGAMFFWASSWVMGKIVATSGLYAPLASTLRMSLLAAFFLPWLLISHMQRYFRRRKAADKSQPTGSLATELAGAFTLDKRNTLYLVLSGLCFAVYNLCFFFGLSTVFSNQAGVLTSVLIPGFSALLYSISHKIRLRHSQVFGLFIGLLSGVILMGGLSVLFVPGAKYYWQSGLFIGAALSWSIITQLSSKIQESYSLQKYSFYTYLFAALLTSWGWIWYEGNILWLPLLALVLLASFIGTSLYFLTLRFLRPNHVASFLFLNPAFILLMSWIVLAEPWTWELTLGSSLAILAILLLNGRRKS